MKKKIISVVGARPNFMKIAPFIRAIEQYNRDSSESQGLGIDHLLVHTGQHYDISMSQSFFRALNIPDPDINLEVGSGSHAEQVGNTMIAFEKILNREKPDWVVLVGDVNATLACSVTAKKEGVKVCHIEAGLRSGDLSMPEEINRLVTDRMADLLLTPDRLSNENLRREGVPEDRIVFVGNIMIDTLEANREQAAALNIETICADNLIDEKKSNAFEVVGQNYALMTMHRPSNVDDPRKLGPLVDFLCGEVAGEMPLIWPIHPRSEKKLKEFGFWEKVLRTNRMIILKPIGYHEMLRLNMTARLLLTDSGGLQEECTVLGTPCLTLRWNTERPVTLRENGGTSELVGNDVERIRRGYRNALAGGGKPVRPEFWDGNTAPRCLEAILQAQAARSVELPFEAKDV
ncbi:MAG: UDP-N-acetylglucosamine 2-epimerase (non-hydrolyzing) [Candidatus Aminicenantes bacterium]|nr:UDP-N-acetylglucosamine 2-epimerase (non-hydrolyzing) [Candidatus Aminicenantes bacterium]